MLSWMLLYKCTLNVEDDDVYVRTEADDENLGNDLEHRIDETNMPIEDDALHTLLGDKHHIRGVDSLEICHMKIGTSQV